MPKTWRKTWADICEATPAPMKDPISTGSKTGVASQSVEAFSSESPGGYTVLEEHADSVRAVGRGRGKSEKDEQGNGNQRSAAREGIDYAGYQAPQGE